MEVKQLFNLQPVNQVCSSCRRLVGAIDNLVNAVKRELGHHDMSPGVKVLIREGKISQLVEILWIVQIAEHR